MSTQHAGCGGRRGSLPAGQPLQPWVQPPEQPQGQNNPPPGYDKHDLDGELSPIPTDTRQLTCTVAMNWNTCLLLNAANHLHQAIALGTNQELHDSSAESLKYYFALHDKLDQLQPNLFDLLDKRLNSHFARNIRQKLSNGWSSTKAQDNNKVKHTIPHLRKWEPPLVNQPKSTCGLAHPKCTFFLFPIIVDWNNQEQKRQFV
ncbi:hypothetical protein FRC07_012046, partial [Ceratobasidium sp. 392]